MVTKRVRLHPIAQFFLHFRGEKGTKSNSHSLLSVCFECAALAILFIVTPALFAAAKLIHDIVPMCRVALAMLIASACIIVISFIIANIVFKKRMQKEHGRKVVEKTKFKDLEGAASARDRIKGPDISDKKPKRESDQTEDSSGKSSYTPAGKEDDKLESFSSAFGKAKDADSAGKEPGQESVQKVETSGFEEYKKSRLPGSSSRRSFYRPIRKEDDKLESFSSAFGKAKEAESAGKEPGLESGQKVETSAFEEYKKSRLPGSSSRRSFYRPIRKEDDKLESFSSAFGKAKDADSADKETGLESGQKVETSGFEEYKKSRLPGSSSRRSFYRPIRKEDENLESFSSAMQTREGSSADEDEPDQGMNSLQSTIKEIKQKNPLEDENIEITRYSQISEKYRGVKMTSSFADAESLRSAQEKMKKKDDGVSDPTGIGAGSSDKPSDLEMLKKFSKE